jgi:tetratricopeptide (TPR) repeat protein
MEEEEKKHGVIVPIGTKSLTQINNSLTVTYKLLYGDIEELFNKAFCLLLYGYEVCDKNYLRIFETDPNHLYNTQYYFYSHSTEINRLALECFTKVFEKRPKFVLSVILRAISKYKLDDFTGSLEDFKKAIELEPNNALIYFNRANLFERLSYRCNHNYEHREAIKYLNLALNDFNKAIELRSDFFLAYWERASIKCKPDPDYQDYKFNFEYPDISPIIDLNDCDGAIEDLSTAIKLNPDNNSLLYSHRAELKYQISQYTGAIDDYSTAISIDLNYSVHYYYGRGKVKESMNDYEGAIADFSKALVLDPNYENAKWRLITIYEDYAVTHENSNDYKSAIDLYSNIIDLDKKNLNAFYKRGLLKNKLGIDVFIEKFNSVGIEVNPYNTMILTVEEFGKSICRESLRFERKYDEIIAIFDTDRKFHVSDIIFENPFILEDTQNLYVIVPLKEERGRYVPLFDDAFLTRTIVNRTNFLEKYSNICLLDKIYSEGQRQYNSWDKDYHLAIEKFTNAIEIEPNFWGCYLDRGLCKHELGDYEVAIQDFSRAIEINPDFAEAYNAKGLSNFALDQYYLAIQDYQKALELNPLFAEAYYNRGDYMFHQGDLNSAYQDFSKAIEFKPLYLKALIKRGNMRYKQGDFLGANDDYTLIISTNYESSKLYLVRASSRLNLSEYDDAIKDLNKAIKLSPTNAEAFKLRAFAKEKIGDFSGAQEDSNEYERLKNV